MSRFIVNKSCAALLLTLGLVFLVAFFNPIFLDEVAYALTLGRFSADNYRRMFLFPQCQSTFVNHLPFLWWGPGLLIESVYSFVGSLSALRLLGTAVAAANSLLLYLILARFSPSRSLAARYLFSLAIGVFPFIFVLARPEGMCLLTALSGLLIARRSEAGVTSAGSKIASITAIVGFALVGISIHPLALTLAPIYFAAIWICGGARRWRYAGIFAILILLIQGYFVHSAYFSCPDAPSIDNHLREYAGSGSGNYSAPIALVESKALNIASSIRLIGEILPHSFYRSGYLPDIDVEAHRFAVTAADTAVLATVVLLFWICLRFFPGFLPAAGEKSARLVIRPEQLLFGAAWLSILLQCAIQPDKYPHRAAILYPLLVLAGGIAVFSAEPGRPGKKWTAVVNIFAAAGLISAIAVTLIYVPVLTGRQSMITFPDQVMSIGRSASDIRLDSIIEAKTICGISDTPSQSRILADQLTYWQILHTREPAFFGFLFWEPVLTVEQFAKQLRTGGIEGILVSCSILPPGLELSPHRAGEICCLGKSDIAALSPAKANAD